MPSIIDYGAIVQELEKALTHTRDQSFPCLAIAETMPKHAALREYFTVGMCLPRQLGTSFFILREMIKNPDTVCIDRSEICIEMKIQQIKEFVDAVKEDRPFNIRGMFYFDIESELKEIIRSQPNLVADMKKRIFTVKKLLKMMDNEEVAIADKKRIYLDCGWSIFTVVKRKKFYDWLGKQNESYIETWIVN